MKRERLIEISERIESELTDSDDAYLGAFYLDHESERFIRANKKGMLQFILLLLNSLKDFDFHLEKEDHFATINIKKSDWFDKNSHLKIDWIEPTKKTRQEIIFEQNNDDKKSESYLAKILSTIIGYSLLFFLIISFLIGVFVVLKWLYKLIF